MPGPRLELDAHRRLLSELLDGSKQYHAPGFQRPYVWKSKDVDVLCDDIEQLTEDATEEASTHFLGAIVLVDRSENSTSGVRRYLIVDGQQRLITLYLYLLALAERLDSLEPGEGKALAGQYLALQFGDPQAPKVLPTEVDFKQFARAVALSGFDSAITVPTGGSNDTGDLSRAFDRVRRRIRTRLDGAVVAAAAAAHSPRDPDDAAAGFTADGGTEGASNASGPSDGGNAVRLAAARRLRTASLTQLKMVEIMLGEGDDAFEVFKTLNTLGVDLRPVDLVRSEVFFRADEAKAMHIFKTRWQPLETALKPDEDRYFFPYALVREPKTKKGELFVELRKLWKTLEVGDVITDIGMDVAPYLVTRRPRSDFDAAVTSLTPILGRKWEIPPGMGPVVARLRRYQLPDVALPFVMRLLREAELDNVPVPEAVKSLEAIETFLVRRAIKGVVPTGLHAVFKTLWSETHGGQASEILGVIQKRATVDFPSDADFMKAVREGPLYRRRNIAPYVLYELELNERKRSGDDDDAIPIWTIDHVMPQSLDSTWKGISDRDHRTLVDTWGNLVPLRREENSRKGNSAWKDIRSYLLVDPDFLTTRKLANGHATWTPAAIRARSDLIAAWAVNRWPLP